MMARITCWRVVCGCDWENLDDNIEDDGEENGNDDAADDVDDADNDGEQAAGTEKAGALQRYKT